MIARVSEDFLRRRLEREKGQKTAGDGQHADKSGQRTPDQKKRGRVAENRPSTLEKPSLDAKFLRPRRQIFTPSTPNFYALDAKISGSRDENSTLDAENSTLDAKNSTLDAKKRASTLTPRLDAYGRK